jgi:hypothetical protein
MSCNVTSITISFHGDTYRFILDEDKNITHVFFHDGITCQEETQLEYENLPAELQNKIEHRIVLL